MGARVAQHGALAQVVAQDGRRGAEGRGGEQRAGPAAQQAGRARGDHRFGGPAGRRVEQVHRVRGAGDDHPGQQLVGRPGLEQGAGREPGGADAEQLHAARGEPAPAQRRQVHREAALVRRALLVVVGPAGARGERRADGGQPGTRGQPAGGGHRGGGPGRRGQAAVQFDAASGVVGAVPQCGSTGGRRRSCRYAARVAAAAAAPTATAFLTLIGVPLLWGHARRARARVGRAGSAGRLGRGEQLLGVRAAQLGVLQAGQHPGQLTHPVLAFEHRDAAAGHRCRRCASPPEVAVGERRHLRQVGHDHDLRGAGQPGQPPPDLDRGLAADAGVDLVEELGRHRVGAGEDHLDGEHDPGQLTAGGALGDGPRRGPGVRGEQQLDLVGAGGP